MKLYYIKYLKIFKNINNIYHINFCLNKDIKYSLIKIHYTKLYKFKKMLKALDNCR